MIASEKPAVLFDVAETLGYLVDGSNGTGPRLNLFAGVEAELLRLSERARLAWMPKDGQSVEAVHALLDSAGIASLFLPGLLPPPARVARTHFLAAARNTQARVFISAEAARRTNAAREGLRVAPHVALAAPLLDGEEVHYLRITAPVIPTQLLAAQPPVLVLQRLGTPSAQVVYAIGAEPARARLGGERLRVDVLGDANLVAEANLLFFSCTPADCEEVFLNRLAAISDVLDRHAHGAVFAVRDLAALDGLQPPVSCQTALVELQPRAHTSSVPYPSYGEYHLDASELAAFEALDDALFDTCLKPWWRGLATQPGRQVGFASRHAHHCDNLRVVAALQQRLSAVCGASHVRSECFTDRSGLTATNVVAEIPGTALAHEIVILSAHLDSLSSGGTWSVDEAPGVDDDASGIAGVLAAAEVFARLPPPLRTIRLVLFNAEELGMVGSTHYARRHVSDNARIVATFQLDMIGHVRGASAADHCEAHTGEGSLFFPGMKEEAHRLGTIVAQAAHELFAERFCVDTYPNDTCSTDYGAGASDHVSFASEGIPACFICEDLYDACTDTINQQHPYHTPSDVHVDRTYASQVARIAAAATWIRANAPHKEETLMPARIRPPYEVGNFALFINRFLRDPGFRFDVLFKEKTSMEDFGLEDPTHIKSVQDLKRGDIIKYLKQEVDLLDQVWGGRLDQLFVEVKTGTPPGCDPQAMSAASLAALTVYTEGQTFFLDYPRQLSPGTEHSIPIKGLGFDRVAYIAFSKCPEDAPPIVRPTTDVTVAADLYQHVTVLTPPLERGQWLIYGANANSNDLTHFRKATNKRGRIDVA